MRNLKLLFIIGSLRRESTNRMLAELAAKEIGDRAEITYLDYGDVPLINPDIEFPSPWPVVRVREQILGADGVWIFFPEYNHSYPGVLKNLLDWISRPVEKGAPRTTAVSSGVPVTYSSISGKGGAIRAFEKMEDLMAKIHMEDLPVPRAAFSEPVVKNGNLFLTEAEMAQIRAQAEAYLNILQSKLK